MSSKLPIDYLSFKIPEKTESMNFITICFTRMDLSGIEGLDTSGNYKHIKVTIKRVGFLFLNTQFILCGIHST
jgi:hypothetical protein